MTRACACPTKPFTVGLFIQARGVLKKELLGQPAIQASHAPLAALRDRPPNDPCAVLNFSGLCLMEMASADLTARVS